MDFEDELLTVMESRNFFIRGKINWSIINKAQRFPDASKKYKRSQDLFVFLHPNGRGATFGDWHYIDDWHTHWNSAFGKPGLYEQRELEKERIKLEYERAYERTKREWRAKQMWMRTFVERDASSHPYVIKKGICSYYARIARTWLLVPVSNIDGDFVTLQIIKPNGFKRLWKGTSAKGLMIWLWDELPNNYGGIIRICEGYATGCTIRQITKSPVVCSVNAHNMPLVAQLLRQKYPSAHLKICADNDQWSEKNVGMLYAKEADRLANAIMHWPVFDGLDVSKKPTDFNDLFLLAGKEALKQQLILLRKP